MTNLIEITPRTGTAFLLPNGARDDIHFTWQGFEEMDEVQGDGSAEIPKDGSINIDLAYHNGDEAVLKAVRDPSSAAC